MWLPTHQTLKEPPLLAWAFLLPHLGGGDLKGRWCQLRGEGSAKRVEMAPEGRRVLQEQRTRPGLQETSPGQV